MKCFILSFSVLSHYNYSQYISEDLTTTVAGVWSLLYVSALPQKILQAGPGAGGDVGHRQSCHNSWDSTYLLCPGLSAGQESVPTVEQSVYR